MKRHKYCLGKLRFFVLGVPLTLGISIPRPVIAQAVPYARTYAKSNEEVDKALKEMQAYAGQKLPIVDGFVTNAEHALDRYERAFYQFSIDLVPAVSGSTVVRVTAKITAWYADRDPSKSGYQVLPSNGRLELDLLDRLSEKFGNKPAASAARSDMQLPKPKLDLSTGLSESPLPSRKTSAPIASSSPGTAPDGPSSEEVAALRVKREAEEKRMRQLNTELQNLQEIRHNQAHPLNLVVVKKTGTPVLARPVAGSHVLFTATTDDEFEFLGIQDAWVHVQISGISRGWVRRADLVLPEEISNVPPDKSAKEDVPSAPTQPTFRLVREETHPFTGSWLELRGKTVRIMWIEPSGTAEPSSPQAKRNFTKSLLAQAYSEISAANQSVAGVVVVFDSADGGQISATISTLAQWQAGMLSEAAFWKQCYLDPPELLENPGKR